MSRYSKKTLTELRDMDKGLYGNLLLAKLEGIQILHEQQEYTDASGSLIEPTVTEYYEREVELTKDAFITDSSEIRTSHTPLSVLDANISGSTVQLLATANNDGSTTIKNAITYNGFGLGDNTTTATSGKISTHAGITIGGITETAIDHVIASGTVTSLLASERTVASFTASQFNGALYHIVSRDLNGTSFEIQKISWMI